jgi:hypothetical protein
MFQFGMEYYLASYYKGAKHRTCEIQFMRKRRDHRFMITTICIVKFLRCTSLTIDCNRIASVERIDVKMTDFDCNRCMS